MKAIFPVALVFLLILCRIPSAFAWNLEIGARSLLPRIGAKEQEYTDKNGDKQTIKPKAETTATGYSYHLGLRLADYSIDLDSSEFGYESSIDASNPAVTETSAIKSKITENRIGINRHLERELAGIYAGVGISNAKEELSSSTNSWVYTTNTPYFKFGIDLILGLLVIRYEQLYMSLGAHSVQINAAGLLLVF